MKNLAIIAFCLLAAHYSFGQVNMTLKAQVIYEDELSDIWGYTDSLGNEYALVCLRGAIAIENITDASNPQNVAIIPAPRSTWRDAKTYGKFAYFINESGGGLQIINLKNLPNTPDTTDVTFWSPTIEGVGELNTCHNIYIDTETGYGYLSGCDINNGGIVIIDLFTSPGNPAFVATAAARYAHDVYVRDNMIYGSDIYDGFFSIQDASNLDTIPTVATQQSPFNFTHNAWLSDDSKTIYTTDETQDAPIGAYDISDINDIKLLDEFRPIASIGTGLIPHNVHVKNDFLVTSFYTEGVIITDGHRPQNLIEVGNYDTFGGSNGSYNGVWGAFPFFESNLIIASDIGSGLYIFEPTYQRASYLEGMVTDSISGEPLDQVNVNILSDDPNEELSNISGEYKTGQVTTGTFMAEYSKLGYFTKLVEVNLNSGEVTLMNVELVKDETVVVNPPPSIVSSVEIGCSPLPLSLSPSLIEEGFVYQWNITGPANFEFVEASPEVQLQEAGTYMVTLGIRQEDGVLSIVAEQEINVLGAPKVNFEVIANGMTVQFNNATEDASSFIWEFGDGMTSEEIAPTHTYTETGPYIVELTAFNACSGSTTSQNIMIMTTGLEELGLLETMEVYPNPFQQQTQLNYQLKETSSKINLVVTDLLGRQLLVKELAQTEGQIAFGDNWNAGIYFLQIAVDGVRSNPLKVIKTDQ